jgi:hypothetical protein
MKYKMVDAVRKMPINSEHYTPYKYSRRRKLGNKARKSSDYLPMLKQIPQITKS